VIALSIGGQSDPRTISDWLVEQAETAGRDRSPRERISLHGNPSDADVEQLDRAIAHHSASAIRTASVDIRHHGRFVEATGSRRSARSRGNKAMQERSPAERLDLPDLGGLVDGVSANQ
jgi:hypothetical protein